MCLSLLVGLILLDFSQPRLVLLLSLRFTITFFSLHYASVSSNSLALLSQRLHFLLKSLVHAVSFDQLLR